jgi:hypothetical protein
MQHEHEKEYAQLTNKLRITLAGHKKNVQKHLSVWNQTDKYFCTFFFVQNIMQKKIKK